MDARKLKEETYQAYYVYSTLKFITYDYDEYYDELLKNALKYGMSISDFYNQDLRYYYFYEEAYYDKLHETAHIQGLYNYRALLSVISSIIPQKNNNKPLEYPQMNIYMEAIQKRNSVAKNNHKTKMILTKENKQEYYMNSLANCY